MKGKADNNSCGKIGQKIGQGKMVKCKKQGACDDCTYRSVLLFIEWKNYSAKEKFFKYCGYKAHRQNIKPDIALFQSNAFRVCAFEYNGADIFYKGYSNYE